MPSKFCIVSPKSDTYRRSFAKHCLAQQTTPAFIKEAVTSLTAVYYLTMQLAGSHNVKVCSSRLVIENGSVTKNGLKPKALNGNGVYVCGFMKTFIQQRLSKTGKCHGSLLS